ncbi:MAG: group II truncated hemoglobin [Pseudomonadales bacterium]|nr:group II truncated hemoglobin [Pseudomonadales bacterium]MBL6813745.1 group II truncated hemoglobin [Pseudomonadales bacterium]
MHDQYGQRDATFQAAGGEAGVCQLVNDFYDIMSSNPNYRRIYDWHPDGNSARDKLARFLCGWMGGPRRYQETYGPINIPNAHRHLWVTNLEKDMWLNCMREALARQNYPKVLEVYLVDQLSAPAEMIRRTCETRNARHLPGHLSRTLDKSKKGH